MLRTLFYLGVWTLITCLMIAGTYSFIWKVYAYGWPPIMWAGLFCWILAMLCYIGFTRVTIMLLQYSIK